MDYDVMGNLLCVLRFISEIIIMPIIIDILISSYKKREELKNLLFSLKNECDLNKVGRGNSRAPFITDILRKAANNNLLYKILPKIYEKVLELNKSAADCNSNGCKMNPGQVQELFKDLYSKVEEELAILEKMRYFRSIFWRIKVYYF